MKLFDGGGLFLLVSPSGGKWWRFKYRFSGKEKLLSLGIYPQVSLRAAREKRDLLKQQLTTGLDPGVLRKTAKQDADALVRETFEEIALEWHGKFKCGWSAGHASRVLRRLEREAFPWLGDKQISAVSASDLLKVLRRTEERGALETAHRVRSICAQVFSYAIATGRLDRNPALDLRGALPPTRERHHPSITDPAAIAGLLRAIASYQGSLVTRSALELASLCFVRPGELRRAEWSEIDLSAAEWRIPAEKMKMKRLHIVPLSKQAVAVLEELRPLTGRGRYVFPGARSSDRPMSENTVNGALRRLGYDNSEMTGHGFRSMASTLLNEQGWHRDAIERQLAHAESDSVRAAYNYAEYLPERRRMMQAWADYLGALRNAPTPSNSHDTTTADR